MSRWLAEWLRPILKCERVGHDPREASSLEYRWPSQSTFRSVADMVRIITIRCNRCHAELGREENVTSLQGLSLPASKWEKLKREGVLS